MRAKKRPSLGARAVCRSNAIGCRWHPVPIQSDATAAADGRFTTTVDRRFTAATATVMTEQSLQPITAATSRLAAGLAGRLTAGRLADRITDRLTAAGLPAPTLETAFFEATEPTMTRLAGRRTTGLTATIRGHATTGFDATTGLDATANITASAASGTIAVEHPPEQLERLGVRRCAEQQQCTGTHEGIRQFTIHWEGSLQEQEKTGVTGARLQSTWICPPPRWCRKSPLRRHVGRPVDWSRRVNLEHLSSAVFS